MERVCVGVTTGVDVVLGVGGADLVVDDDAEKLGDPDPVKEAAGVRETDDEFEFLNGERVGFNTVADGEEAPDLVVVDVALDDADDVAVPVGVGDEDSDSVKVALGVCVVVVLIEMVDCIEYVVESRDDGDEDKDAHDAVPDFELVVLAETLAEFVDDREAEFDLMERVTDGLPDARPLVDALGVLDDERESVRDERAEDVVVAVPVADAVPDAVLVRAPVVEPVLVAVAVAVDDGVVDDD